MTYEIRPSSDALKTDKRKLLGGEFEKSLPFEQLQVHQSFAVPINDVKQRTLEEICRRVGKRLGKRFRVVAHEGASVFEVGRLDDPVKPAPVTASPVNEPQPVAPSSGPQPTVNGWPVPAGEETEE